MLQHTFRGLKTETHKHMTIQETSCICGIRKRTMRFNNNEGSPPITRYYLLDKIVDPETISCKPVPEVKAPAPAAITADVAIDMEQGNYTPVEARLLEAFVIMRTMLSDLNSYGVDLEGHASLRMAKTFVKSQLISFH